MLVDDDLMVYLCCPVPLVVHIKFTRVEMLNSNLLHGEAGAGAEGGGEVVGKMCGEKIAVGGWFEMPLWVLSRWD